jgi:DNA-binding NarL/FixJ family response regulator
MKTPIHIILVEDNPGYREVIELTLADASDMQLDALFGTAEAALQALQDTPEKPDMVLLDINLPGISGIEAIPQIKALSPDTQIIMLTQSDNEADVVEAIQTGATGYLLKSASIEEIIQGIRSVADGGSSLDAGVAKYIVDALHASPSTAPVTINLSDRESEILTLLSEGFSKKQIADQLGIGIHTVGDHVKQIYRKLNVPNAPAAVSKGFRSGILRSEDDQ